MFVVLIETIYLVWAYFFTEYWPNEEIAVLCQLFIYLLIACYIVLENREKHYIYHPYELGLFVWLAWPIALPYYLYKSRGAKGLILFLGILTLSMIDQVIYFGWYHFSSVDA